MADYGIQVFSEANGNTLFDSNKPYKGMAVVETGIVNAVTVFNPPSYSTGIIYDDGDLVFIKPEGDVPSGSMYLVYGKSYEYTSVPLKYKLHIKIDSFLGTAPTSMQYVVLRPASNISTAGETYGLQTFYPGSPYIIKTFDSRAFQTGNEIQIDYVWISRFQHTTGFGTINNDEWYSPSSFQMYSGTGFTLRVGIVFSNSTGSYNAGGPFPNTFTGTGHSHFGQYSSYSGTFNTVLGDYQIRAKSLNT
jgi:hypothetical protein